jgi:hypothetical protein
LPFFLGLPLMAMTFMGFLLESGSFNVMLFR